MFKLFSDRKQSRKRLNELLKGFEPPSFQPGVMKLLKLLRDPSSELSEIADTLSWDPGLVVKVLRMVNSAAYGLQNKVYSVQHAVSILGRTKIEQLVLSIAVKDTIPKTSVAGFDSQRFWNSAFFRASLARKLAEQLHPAQQTTAFTAGLLQDMAIPLLAHSREDYPELLSEWHANKDVRLYELEQKRFGWSHDEAGGLLAVEWELPEELAHVIHVHHSSEVTDAELPPALRLVAIHRETETEHGLEALTEDARSLYGLEPEWIEASYHQCIDQARELSQAL